MAKEEKKEIRKVMIVPPPPTDGSEPVRIVMKDDPDSVIKVVTKKAVSEVAIRDENVQEILTSVPHWMIRWGNVLFLGLILMIIGISWMVKYPDVVSIPVVVQTTNPDANITYAKSSTIKDFLVADNQYVVESESLLIYENNAITEDVMQLQKLLNSITITSREIIIPTTEIGALKLGDLQAPFASFQADYQIYTSDKNDKDKFRNAIITYENLRKKLNDWNQKNVIKAPVSGTIKLPKATTDLKVGDVVLEIKSDKKQAYFSQIISENSGFQKIKKGQEVQVSLSVYPEYENGVLIGEVKAINWDTSLKKYVVEISFPENLKTTYGVAVNPDTNLSGIANIITKRKRLLERLFSNF